MTARCGYSAAMLLLLAAACASRSNDVIEAPPPEYAAVLDAVAFDAGESGAHEVDGATWAKTGLRSPPAAMSASVHGGGSVHRTRPAS